MKRHPVIARDLLGRMNFLSSAIDIPYFHHEKWDGSGYPDGLVGENIPYLARIMAVADVWSALTTPRVYRVDASGKSKAFTPEKALSIMEEMANGHFDPQVFPLFQEIIRGMMARGESTSWDEDKTV